ncbi:WXG100 family type VII secretion target [Nocardia sp. NBC_01730]|uniref:WXG100 family type VII secretion target n=1 Tax=Nocardia sp. NBC_01730 TaxID=2975998 RepID=UPI002E0FA5F0|nr:WXG100 family type VII secretion target [Nocardia sp. NBC_01730]
MSAEEAREFSVDLQHLEDVTARVRGFKEFVAGYLSELDSRASALGTSWSGPAAAAYTDAHREWIVGATDVQEGLQALEDATRRAHETYTGAVTTNMRMLGR